MYIAEGRYDFMNTKASSDFNHTDWWVTVQGITLGKMTPESESTVDLSLKIVLFVFLFCHVLHVLQSIC